MRELLPPPSRKELLPVPPDSFTNREVVILAKPTSGAVDLGGVKATSLAPARVHIRRRPAVISSGEITHHNAFRFTFQERADDRLSTGSTEPRRAIEGAGREEGDAPLGDRWDWLFANTEAPGGTVGDEGDGVNAGMYVYPDPAYPVYRDPRPLLARINDAVDDFQDKVEGALWQTKRRLARAAARLWSYSVDKFAEVRDQVAGGDLGDLARLPGQWASSRLVGMTAMARRGGETDERFEARRAWRDKTRLRVGYATLVGAAALAIYRAQNGASGDSSSLLSWLGFGDTSLGSSSTTDNNATLGSGSDSLNGWTEQSTPSSIDSTSARGDKNLLPPSDLEQETMLDDSSDSPTTPEEGSPKRAAPTEIDAELLSEASRKIERGDGGLRMLEKMGVPAADRARVWEMVGKELSETDLNLVYWEEPTDGQPGEWRLNYRPEKLTEDELNKIVQLVNDKIAASH